MLAEDNSPANTMRTIVVRIKLNAIGMLRKMNPNRLDKKALNMRYPPESEFFLSANKPF